MPAGCGGAIFVLGIRRDWVAEVQPFVVREANKLGLVCYDMKRGKLYLSPPCN